MNNKIKLSLILITLLIGCFATGANARSTFQVDAKANSVSGGVGLNTGIAVTQGQLLTIDARTADMWTIKQSDDAFLCNANGEGNPFGSNRAIPFTLPGTDFSFLFGTLVGSLDDGKTFFPIGTHSEQIIAKAEGLLTLYMWDSDNLNNAGLITVDVDVYNSN